MKPLLDKAFEGFLWTHYIATGVLFCRFCGVHYVRPQTHTVPPKYPQSNIALTDARVVAVTWGLLAASGVAWFAYLFAATPFGIVQSVFAVFVTSGFVHVFVSLMHKCPTCGKHPTIQGFKPPHADSTNQSKASGWAGAVINILRRRQLVCIHCGTQFRIEA